MPAVEIVEYQSTWPDAFGASAGELAGAMSGSAITVEHIGSTAVPGLCAKPIIDVLLGLGALNDVESRIPALSALGYRYRPEYEEQIPQRRYFVKDACAAMPRVHVHAVLVGGPLWRDHLAFRNALRQDRQLMDRYAHLKRELARVLSKSEYTQAKAPFIQAVLKPAPPGQTPGAN